MIESEGLRLIAAERQRQVDNEWTEEHDDGHPDGAIADAAACLASTKELHTWRTISGALLSHSVLDPVWPWEDDYYNKLKGHDRIHQLAIAGALIAAEIDRLKRLEARES